MTTSDVAAVGGEPAAEERRPGRAAAPGLGGRHRRAGAEGPRLVGRRRDDAPAAHPADDDRPAAQRRLVALLDGGEEGVEVQVQDARLPPHTPILARGADGMAGRGCVPSLGGLPCPIRAATDEAPGDRTAGTTVEHDGGDRSCVIGAIGMRASSSSRCSWARSAERCGHRRRRRPVLGAGDRGPRRRGRLRRRGGDRGPARRPCRTPSPCCSSVAVGLAVAVPLAWGAVRLSRAPAGHADPGDADPRTTSSAPRASSSPPCPARATARSGWPWPASSSSTPPAATSRCPAGTPVYVVETLSDTAVEVVSTAPDPLPAVLPEPGGNHP